MGINPRIVYTLAFVLAAAIGSFGGMYLSMGQATPASIPSHTLPNTALNTQPARQEVSIMASAAIFSSPACSEIVEQRPTNPALSTPAYPDNMRFTRYWNGSNFTSGIYVAVIGVVIGIVLFYRTPLGSKIRLCGDNLQFAVYSGINALSGSTAPHTDRNNS